MAHAIEENLKNREKEFENLLQEEELIKKIFAGELTGSDVSKLSSLPFGIYAYKNDTISFWNNNKVLVDCINSSKNSSPVLVVNERGRYLKKCVVPDYLAPGQALAVLYPVVTLYPFENNYLQSSFEANDNIPISTAVSSRKTKGNIAVKNQNGESVFYISFDKSTPPLVTPGRFLITLIVLGLLCSVFWIQLMIAFLVRKRSAWSGFFVLTAIILAVEIYVYRVGLPFHLEQMEIFRPHLYASSAILKSLGHLLINALLFLWLMAFMIRYVPIFYLDKVAINKVIKYSLAVLISIALLTYSFAFINVVSSLVTDSKISFDVSHFYTISSYTLLGLFIVSIIVTGAFLFIYIASKQLNILVKKKRVKYLILAAIGVAMLFISDKAIEMQIAIIMLGCLLLFIMLLDIPQLGLRSDLFAPQMIFWAAVIIAFTTGILQYFNYLKEKEARMRFAERVVQQRDDITEYTFRRLGDNIGDDPVVKQFLIYPSRSNRKAINERFDAIYLGGHLNKYQSRLLFFDKRGRSLYNNDTLSYNTLNKRIDEAMPTFTKGLYHIENARDGRYYVAKIPVQVGDTSNMRTLGYVFIDFAVKESTGETVYPELLQPGSVKGERNIDGYSYGVYVNGKLITQTSDYNFPVYLPEKMDKPVQFTNYSGSSELRMKIDDEKMVFVIRYHRLWLESITLFSYLFGIQMLVFLISILYSIYLHYFVRISPKEKLINFTLRRRIHISFLGIVFISFIIIGFITIFFFTYQYKQNSTKKQQLIVQLVERAVLQYMNEENALGTESEFTNEVLETRFKYFITGLSNTQKIDINLYHPSGVLSVTSQEDIYDKALFARIMQPDAYHKLSALGNRFLIQDEQIGQLSYVSSYKPLRNQEGETLGYLNIPFFSSEKELNFQISSIVVGLINLYAFVFLISGVLTLFITRWITKSLSVVIKSFSRFSLSKNEPVDWPYDDEIGVLVKEYNRMVKKAEQNAKLLAQSEREGAWREMAKQVAHEIKNPLTPMKLNIQYLQQALKNDYPNVNQLAAKVSESLIEQIENLSYIASEFSNFAKIPEAKPEEFELNEMLKRIVDLYKNQGAVTVHYEGTSDKVFVYADKSQLLRVCNNLMENAVQAIPEERAGDVIVSLGKEGDDALLSFKDNGSGIEDEAISKIFQPYFTTKTSGTGLGLAMTKKIIEFWKGDIRFETTPGKGTTFYITLPIASTQNGT